MKLKYVILTLSIIIGLFLTVNKSYADNDICYTIEEGKDCGDWIPYGFDMTYLNCTVHIDYYVRVCTIQQPNCKEGEVFFRLETKIKQIDWDWEQCQTLTQALFPGYPDNFGTMNYVQFGVLFSEASSLMAKNAFENFYNNLPPDEQTAYNCLGTPPNCGNPTWEDKCEADVYYSNFSCQFICWYFKGPGTGGSGPSVITMAHSCESASSTCCAHYVKYCKCGDEIFSINYIESDGLCEDAIPPTPDPCFNITGYDGYSSGGCITICQ